eukprot:1985965-Prymnesium_polylepis.1
MNTSITNSRAADDGGAMCIMAGKLTVADGSSIVGSSSCMGGLLFIQGGTAFFCGTTVLASSANANGNAMYLNGGRVTVDHSRIARSFRGASCFVLAVGELHLISSTVERGESYSPDGVILYSSSDDMRKLLVITNTDFRQHACDGTLFSLSTATVVLRNLSFTPLPGCDAATLASPARFAGAAMLSCSAKYRSEVDDQEWDV